MQLLLLPLGLWLAWLAGPTCFAQEVPEGPRRKAGDVAIERFTGTAVGHGKVDYELGTLFVPENRAEKKSRLIGVGFARFKATHKTGSPPLFMLPGGPGGSYLNNLKPGEGLPGQFEQFLRLRAVSDVILVDQRGYSTRGDVLKFRYRTSAEPLDQPASIERSTKAFTGLARAAVQDYDKKGIDLRGYTVKECADDVNDLRQALGYEKITLVGGSFGSQWSFAIMRKHPETVARALLTGVEPLDCGYDMPSHIMAAIQRIWFAADRDERLKPYLPPGGLAAAAREVLQRLEREPIRVPLKGVTDPKTGEVSKITLGHEDFQKAPALRSIAGPAFVLSLFHGQYDQWAFASNLSRRGWQVDFPMITALIDTSMGVSPRRGYLLRNDPATAFLGQWNFHSYMATADIWPTPDVGDEFRAEVDCSIPVVFVQGDWDTQTPVENLLHVTPYFRKGHVLLVERGGHGAMGQIARHLPKTMESLFEFLKDGTTTNLPASVEVPAPKFTVPNFPAPKK